MHLSLNLRLKNTITSKLSPCLAGVVLLLSTATVASAQQSSDRQGRKGPPPEAFEACEYKSVGDSCTVNLPDDTLAGECNVDRGRKKKGGGKPGGSSSRSEPSEQRLICIPEGHESRPPRGEQRPD